MISITHTRAHRNLLAAAALLLIVALVPSKGYAQQPFSPPDMSRIAAGLNLTAQQEPAFTEIMENHIAATKALLDRHGVDPSKGRPSRQVMRELRGEMMQNREQLELALTAVLTPEQLKQLKEMSQKRRRR